MASKVICAVVLLGLAHTVRGQGAVSEMGTYTNAIIFNALDTDESGKLEISEINAGFLIGAFPERFSFVTPPKEKDFAELANTEQVRTRTQAFFQRHPLKPAYELAEIDPQRDLGFDRMPREPKITETAGEPRVVLRRTRDDIPKAFVEDETKKDLIKNAKGVIGKGALFSYSRDFETSTDQWATEGVLAWVVPSVGRNFDLPSLNSWLFFGQWERVDLGGDIERDAKTRGGISPSFKSKESNSLMLGVETRQQINFPQIPGVLAGFIVKAAGQFHTDFDFQSAIPTFEFEAIPVGGNLGLGSYQTKWDALYWRLTPAFHFDLGHVSSDGEWTKSKQNTTFAHVGPKILLELMPFPKNPFVTKMPVIFTISVLKLAALTDDSMDAHEYTVDASIYLRKASTDHPFDPNVALSIALKRIDDIENKKDDDSLTLGLAVGF